MPTLTLRPNSDISIQTPLASYTKVDEEVADDDTTRNYNNVTNTTKSDVFGLPNHTSEAGIINSVKIYYKGRQYVISLTPYASFAAGLYISGSSYMDSNRYVSSWTTYNKTWTINPNTSAAWTWSDIDALQVKETLIGYSYDGAVGYGQMTQIYVEVDYSGAQTISPTGLTTGYASGTANIKHILSPSSISTLASLGATGVTHRLLATGIATIEAIGTAQLNFTIYTPSIPTAEFINECYVIHEGSFIVAESISTAEAMGTAKVVLLLSPSSIVSGESVGDPLVTFTAGIISPSSITTGESFGAAALTITLVISPTGIPSGYVSGLAKVMDLTPMHAMWEATFLDSLRYTNRVYVIGQDQDNNQIYALAEDGSINEPILQIIADSMIPTQEDAEKVAANALSKARMEKDKGNIVIYPNCGMEMWDVISVTDTVLNQAGAKYRVNGWTLKYDPLNSIYEHNVKLTEV